MKYAPGTDAEYRHYTGHPLLCKAPSYDVHSVLSGRKILCNPCKKKDFKILRPEHDPTCNVAESQR